MQSRYKHGTRIEFVGFCQKESSRAKARQGNSLENEAFYGKIPFFSGKSLWIREESVVFYDAGQAFLIGRLHNLFTGERPSVRFHPTDVPAVCSRNRSKNCTDRRTQRSATSFRPNSSALAAASGLPLQRKKRDASNRIQPERKDET